MNESYEHIVAILTLVHSKPFGEGKISVILERKKSRKFLIVIMLSHSDFNETFDSKITRKWSDLKGVVVTL